MVLHVEVAGDEGRGLAPDPRGEGLRGLGPVVLDHLDRARDGIWVKSFLRRCGGRWGRRAGVVCLSGIWACVARLGSLHLPKRTVLLRRITSLHAGLRRVLLQRPRGA